MNHKNLLMAAALVASTFVAGLPTAQAENCNNYGIAVTTYNNSPPDCSSKHYYQYCDQGTGAGAGAGSGSGAGSNQAGAQATAGTSCTQNNGGNSTGSGNSTNEPDASEKPTVGDLPEIGQDLPIAGGWIASASQTPGAITGEVAGLVPEELSPDAAEPLSGLP